MIMAQYRTGIPKFMQHLCCDKDAAEIWASVMMERKGTTKENSEECYEIQKVKKLNKPRP